MEEEKNREERIKEVARALFLTKGYAATSTREIVDGAGVNIALLNYYYKSKENLFRIIMIESIQAMFMLLSDIINDTQTSLSEKIDLAVDKYIDVPLANPHLPLFVLNELRAQPGLFLKKAAVPRQLLGNSLLFKQLQEHIEKKGLAFSPIHIFVNVAGMALMPVIGRPFVGHLYKVDDGAYDKFIEERRSLIKIWIKQMLQINTH